MQEIVTRAWEVLKEFSVYDAIEIVVFAFIVYFLFSFFKRQNAAGLVKYCFMLLAMFVIVFAFQAYIPNVYKLFVNFSMLFAVIVVILFATDFRRFLWRFSSGRKNKATFSGDYDCSDEDLREATKEIVRALQDMSKKNVGALMVFANIKMPVQILDSGTKLDSILSSELLESIFITKGPLHDGAVIIRGNKILSAGCFLPLSQNLDLPKDLGTRHRAAIGVTESLDVTTIIVSEETGVISVAKKGIITRYYDTEMLTETLEQIFGLKGEMPEKKKKRGKG